MVSTTFTQKCQSFVCSWQSAFLLLLLLAPGLVRPAQAQSNSSLTSDVIYINNGSSTLTYGGLNAATFPNFESANLGTFDLSDYATRLQLLGGSLNTQEATPDIFTAATLYYQLTKTSVSPEVSSTVQSITLTQEGTLTNGTRTFTRVDGNADLLSGLTAGTYAVDVYFIANGRNTSLNKSFTKQDPNGTSYTATFTVTGVRPTEPQFSTTWTGGVDDNWFDPGNWTRGVPTATMDATIPDFPAGSTVKYPNIYSDAVKPDSKVTTRTQRPDGSFVDVTTDVPGYSNLGSGPAKTRNLMMLGTDQVERAITRLQVGRLEVYGNFGNDQDSFIQRDKTTISFAGGNQTISGSTSGFVNVEIDGSGIKSLINSFPIQAGGKLVFKAGVLKTDISKTGSSFVRLFPSTIVNNAVVPSARIEGETESSYLHGLVIIDSPAPVGTNQDFGNIGLTLNFSGLDPGTVTVTRNTGKNVADINNGTNSSPGIRRIFGVRPAVGSGLSATMTFHYLDNETVNLLPSNNSVNENKLSLFLSTSGGDTFGQLGRDQLTPSTNTLVKYNVTSFATFTLSEGTIVLPVTLTAFDAKRVGNNTELTWETSSERNNRGYDVQVSTDGRTFRSLSFVGNDNPNSTQLQRYRYLDTEANKTGVRYYRLRQVDLDGREAYYAKKAVTFSGAAPARTTVASYPNPFQQEVTMQVQTASAGAAQLVLLDLSGREVRRQAVNVMAGSNDFALQQLGNLPAGAYLLRLSLPDGQAQSVRVLKN